MENESIGARNYQNMSRKNILRLVNGVCRAYQIPRVILVYKDLGKWAAEWSSPNFITLNTRKRTSMDFITITHELAHHLHASFGDATDDHESHGAEFMGCHMSILDTCRGIPVCAMRVICTSYGVRYVDPGDKRNLVKLLRAVIGNPR